jgi:nucleolar protein 15
MVELSAITVDGRSKKDGKSVQNMDAEVQGVAEESVPEVVQKKKKKKGGKPVDEILEQPVSSKPSKKADDLGADPDAKSTPQASPMATKSKSVPAPRKSTTTISGTPNESTKKSKKAKAKEPSPEPESEPSLPSDVEGDVHFDSGEDDEIHLHGFSTDGDDSSDEEGAMDFEAIPLDITKLPTVAKDDATVKRKLDKAKRQPVSIFYGLWSILSNTRHSLVGGLSRCHIHRTLTARVLRGPAQGVFLPIWHSHTTSCLTE